MPLYGTLFSLWLSLSCGIVLAACPADRVDEEVRVAHVFDGDTVRLSDGRRVRFIGIDTPEIDHRGGRSEPYSRAAQRRLEHLLGKERRLLLRYDNERKDHYGRSLAHPYLSDGKSLNAILLEEGLATTMLVTPNDWQHDCYRRAMARARDARIGIWSLPSHRLTPVIELSKRDQGYAWVAGRVQGIRAGRDSRRVLLEGGLQLYIASGDLSYFEEKMLAKLPGTTVEVDGWLQGEIGKWRMRLRHPSQLKVMVTQTVR